MGQNTVNGPQGKLCVDDGGQGGTPLIFLHCNGGNLAQWSAELERLRATRRAVAFDFRGHGRSDPANDEDYTARGRAQDVAAVAEALGFERFVLVGHSGGGMVALEFAAVHPDRVVGLMLVDPTTDGRQIPKEQSDGLFAGLESPEYSEVSQGFYAQIAGPNPEVRDRILTDLADTRREVFTATMRELVAYNPEPALRAYRGPRRSLVTPANDVEAAYHRLDPSLPHRVIEGTGHWLFLDRPDTFRVALGDFLGAL